MLDVDAFHASQQGVLESCGALPFAGASCGECMSSNCCNEASDCAREGVCSAKQTCVSQCARGDSDCISTCSADIPYHTNAERALAQCLVTQCADACQIECGRSEPPVRAGCLQKQPGCCENERAIWSDPSASAWQACQSACFRRTNTTELLADACGCVTANPGSEALAEKAASCANTCFSPAPDWSCLGHVQWPDNNDGPTLTYNLLTADLATSTPVPDVRVSACLAVDTLCELPLGPVQTTDGQAQITLTLTRRTPGNSDFIGYFLQQARGIVDTLSFLFPPPRQSQTQTHATLTPQTKSVLHQAVGATEDPALGLIGIELVDCTSIAPASGVRVTSSVAGQVVYVNNSLPDLKLTASTASGQALIYGVPPGLVHLEATLEATGQLLGKVDVVSRAGGFTLVLFPPTP